MKRYNHSTRPKHTIEITLFVDPEDIADVATSSRVRHPQSVKKRYLYSDQQLADFNDLVDSVYSVIDHFDFDIVDEGQSKKSYSYYIDFFPTDQNSDRWDDSIQIKFRLSNHSNRGADNKSSNTSNRGQNKGRDESDKPMIYVKSFMLGSKQYPGQFAIMQAVKKICISLKAGDYTVLDNY